MTILTQNTISSASQIHLNHRVIQRQYAQSIKIIQYQTWMLVSSDSLYKLFSFTWLLTTLLHRVISLYEYGAQEMPTRMVVSHATNMVPFFSVDALFTYNSSPTTLYQDCSAFPSPFSLAFVRWGWCRIAVPVPLTLVDEPVVDLL